MSAPDTESEDVDSPDTSVLPKDLAGSASASLATGVSETEDGEPFVMHGVALGSGDVTVGKSRTKKKWPAAMLKEAAPTLEGQPLVRHHTNNAQGTVGEITKSRFAPGVGVLYEAEIAPHYEELAKDIQAGILEVSPRILHPSASELEQDDESGALVIHKGIFDNLSVVADGASPSNSAEPGPSPKLSPNQGAIDVASATVADHDGGVAVLSAGSDRPDPESVDEMLAEGAADMGPDPDETSEEESDATNLDDPDDAQLEETPADDVQSDPAETTETNDDPEQAVTVASWSQRNGTATLTATFSPTMDINYEEASDDAVDELEDAVVVEKSDIEALEQKASRADDLDDRLEEMNSSLEELGSAQDTLDELDDEAVEALSEADDPKVVEADEHEELSALVDDVSGLYAEELSEHSPFEAEELTDRFGPTELRDKVDAHEEAELSADIEAEDPEPEGEAPESEELSETEEELEREEREETARERVAEELRSVGWDAQAEKVEDGEISLDEFDVDLE